MCPVNGSNLEEEQFALKLSTLMFLMTKNATEYDPRLVRAIYVHIDHLIKEYGDMPKTLSRNLRAIRQHWHAELEMFVPVRHESNVVKLH